MEGPGRPKNINEGLDLGAVNWVRSHDRYLDKQKKIGWMEIQVSELGKMSWKSLVSLTEYDNNINYSPIELDTVRNNLMNEEAASPVV